MKKVALGVLVARAEKSLSPLLVGMKEGKPEVVTKHLAAARKAVAALAERTGEASTALGLRAASMAVEVAGHLGDNLEGYSATELISYYHGYAEELVNAQKCFARYNSKDGKAARKL